MTRTVVLGASGVTGGLLCDVFDELGVPFVAAGRDPSRVRARVGDHRHLEDVVAVDVHEPATLHVALEPADVVVSTVGPFTRLGRPVLDAAIATGTHYADSTGELPFVRWAHDDAGPRAAAAGVTAVTAAAMDFLPGDLLAAVAAGALEAPTEVHITYLVRARGPLPGYATSGTRSSVAEVLGTPTLAVVRGATVEERLAEERRLAWFPKPIGPHHAAAFPGAEPLTVPRHVSGLTTVRTYLAVPTVAAELTQAVGTLAARSERVRSALAGVLRANGRDATPEQRARVRWACVVEAVDAEGTLARAWLNGRDIYRFTAHCLALTAQALATGRAPAGVVAPAEVLDPADALDTLAARADVRWSVRRPTV